MMLAFRHGASLAIHSQMLVTRYLATAVSIKGKIPGVHMIQFRKIHCKDALCNSTMASPRRILIFQELRLHIQSYTMAL